MSTREQELRDNLENVRRAMHQACSQAHRSVDTVRLVAVSKTKPIEDILLLVRAGQLEFGENYMQEALKKIDAAQAANIKWHLIGTLQSNKAKLLTPSFSLFHGLYNLSLAKKLNQYAEKAGRVQDCLVEINIDEELSKGGLLPSETPYFLEQITELKNINITGFMCIPSAKNKDPRRPFAKLRELLESANALGCYRAPLRELSMGMSQDFEAAISEGATIIRVGTKIFGAR